MNSDRGQSSGNTNVSPALGLIVAAESEVAA